jgi:hypothetical protein
MPSVFHATRCENSGELSTSSLIAFGRTMTRKPVNRDGHCFRDAGRDEHDSSREGRVRKGRVTGLIAIPLRTYLAKLDELAFGKAGPIELA